MAGNTQRYDAVAMLLHWAIFILLVMAVKIGWSAEDLPKDQIPAAMGLHKSIGLTILLLSFVRLGWRVANPPPPLPTTMSRRDEIIMKSTHHLFYILMIGIPLVGYIMSSTGAYPLKFWGLFDFPKLPLEGMKPLGKVMGFMHGKLVWLGIILMVLHVAAALKHQFVGKTNILGRMIPFI